MKFADPCHPACAGWAVFNEGQEFAGGDIQACDECREVARVTNLPARCPDDDVAAAAAKAAGLELRITNGRYEVVVPPPPAVLQAEVDSIIVDMNQVLALPPGGLEALFDDDDEEPTPPNRRARAALIARETPFTVAEVDALLARPGMTDDRAQQLCRVAQAQVLTLPQAYERSEEP